MKFITTDNKVFDSIKEAQKHENELAEAAKKKEELFQKQTERYEEVDAAYKKYITLLKQYVKDYGIYHSNVKINDNDERFSLLDLFENFFN